MVSRLVTKKLKLTCSRASIGTTLASIGSPASSSPPTSSPVPPPPPHAALARHRPSRMIGIGCRIVTSGLVAVRAGLLDEEGRHGGVIGLELELDVHRVVRVGI